MFVDTDLAVLLVEFLAVIVIISLSVVAYRRASGIADARWRRPWWAVAAVVLVGFVVLTHYNGLVSASRALQNLSTQVGFPADYAHDDSRLTLDEGDTATLRKVVLADTITKNAAGRWCLSGTPTTVSGDGRWFMDASGFAQIEVDGKVARLYPDGGLLGYGWRVGYLLTPCDSRLATTYLPTR